MKVVAVTVVVWLLGYGMGYLTGQLNERAKALQDDLDDLRDQIEGMASRVLNDGPDAGKLEP